MCVRGSEFVCSMAARFCARTSVAYFEICYTSQLRLFRPEIKARAYIWPNSDTKSSISTSKRMGPPRILIILCSPQRSMVSARFPGADFSESKNRPAIIWGRDPRNGNSTKFTLHIYIGTYTRDVEPCRYSQPI